jgi:hypothetical protein
MNALSREAGKPQEFPAPSAAFSLAGESNAGIESMVPKTASSLQKLRICAGAYGSCRPLTGLPGMSKVSFC